LFFVDKDHDDLIPGARGGATEQTLFVTTYYSIENYCATSEVLRTVLIDLCGLDSSNPAIAEAISEYERLTSQVYQECMRWMAWVIAVRISGEQPQNDNVKLREVFSIDEELSLAVNWHEGIYPYLQRVSKIQSRPSEDDIMKVYHLLEAKPPKTWLRGKAEIGLFVLYLERLVSVSKKCPSPLKPRYSIGFANAIEVLAPRTSIPNDLSAFVSEWFSRVKSRGR
jgi:hypothetical protein